MLTRLKIHNFKTLDQVDIPLGQNVVFIGPNNSGKTSALQALAIWQTGLLEWNARRPASSTAKDRPGVTVNRRAITHTPVSKARYLWNGLKVTANSTKNGGSDTKHVFFDVLVDGETDGNSWSCGFEFQHANSESIYCRPLKDLTSGHRLAVPAEAAKIKIALLPPMSGLATEEPEVQPGRVSVLMGEGQTAQVLRNLCFQVAEKSPENWQMVVAELKRTFGIELKQPRRDKVRGTIELSYIERGIELDLSSAGRGLQQTLLLLAHLHANPGSVLLLDEPDAHLEILRQRQIYALISDTARRTGSQVIAASHSEILLDEAAQKDVVIAFVGAPHRIDNRGAQLRKALRDIGYDQYYQAMVSKFVLYLEGATDLAILKALARKLNHPSVAILDKVFVHYVLNHANDAANHFHGLREAVPDLKTVAVFDRLMPGKADKFVLPHHFWRKREIENYFCTKAVLLRFAGALPDDDLLHRELNKRRMAAMTVAIDKVQAAFETLGRNAWSDDEKISDDVLPSIFANYFNMIGEGNSMVKSNFHVLADFVLPGEIDGEIHQVLDLIVAEAANVDIFHPG